VYECAIYIQALFLIQAVAMTGMDWRSMELALTLTCMCMHTHTHESKHMCMYTHQLTHKHSHKHTRTVNPPEKAEVWMCAQLHVL
jgi:hypothetical protein